jgi:rubrerythrin
MPFPHYVKEKCIHLCGVRCLNTKMVFRLLRKRIAAFSESDQPNELQKTQSNSDQSIDLYTCSNCTETYIKNSMEKCPQCDESVEPTPSFSDLGIIPKGRN